MKYKNWEDNLKKTLPIMEEVECKKCERKFFDEWNLLSLSTFDMCMLCTNRYVDKETIKRKYNVK